MVVEMRRASIFGARVRMPCVGLGGVLYARALAAVYRFDGRWRRCAASAVPMAADDPNSKLNQID